MNDVASGDDPGKPPPGAGTVLALIDPRVLRRSLLLRFLAEVSDAVIVAGADVDEVRRHQEGADVSTVIVNVGGESLANAGNARAQVAAAASAFPDAPIVVLSDLESRQEVRETLNLGACGFIPTSTPEHLVWPAIQLVSAGGLYAPVGLLVASERERGGGVGDQPAQHCSTRKSTTADGEDKTEDDMESRSPSGTGHCSGTELAEDRTSALTPREIEVLGRVSQGLQNKQIAYVLGMSESTVKVHVRHILKKLAVTNRTQAAFRVTGLAPQLLRRPGHQPRAFERPRPVSPLGDWRGTGALAAIDYLAPSRPLDYALSGSLATAGSATLRTS